MRGLFGDFYERVVQLELSLFRTTWHLFSRPQQVIRAFNAGKRRFYTHPFTYLILVSTVSLLLANLIGDNFWNEYRRTMMNYSGHNLDLVKRKHFADFYVLLLSLLPYWMLVFTLPLALLMKLFFPKRGFTTAEYWIVCLYGVAFAILIDVLWSLCCYLFKLPFATQSLVTNFLLISFQVLFLSLWLGKNWWSFVRILVGCLISYALIGTMQNLMALAYANGRVLLP